jgi:hypothetical protein
MLIWAYARIVGSLNARTVEVMGRLTTDFTGHSGIPNTLMIFHVGCCAMAAPTPEINFDDPGPGRGAGSSGQEGPGTTELAGWNRRSTRVLNQSGPCICVSGETGSRPQMHGQA